MENVFFSKNLENVLEKYEIDNLLDFIIKIQPRTYKMPFAFTEIKDITNYPDGTEVTVFGYIEKVEELKLNSNKITKIKGKLFYNGYSVVIHWITAKSKLRKFLFSLEQTINEGKNLLQVTGKVDSFNIGGKIIKYLKSPTIKIAPKKEENNINLFQKIYPEPIYPLKNGITNRNVHESFKEIIFNWNIYMQSYQKELMPEELAKQMGYPKLLPSLMFMHGFKEIDMVKFNEFIEYAMDKLKRRIKLEYIWQILVDKYKRKISHVKFMDHQLVEFDDNDIEELKNIIKNQIPFDLTMDQKKVLWRIMKNVQQKGLTNSLIFGDVGTGKTIVALILSYLFYKKGYQSVIMAPTAILAKQHYEEFKKYFPKNVKVFLLHSKTKKREKELIQKILDNNEPAIIIGTHSVNNLKFSKLKLLIIDEEQKFGVKDKEKLYNEYKPHLIYMTATPIPRTLTNALFSDFDIYKITEKPAIQKPRKTYVKEFLTQEEIAFIKSKLLNGEKALVVVPSIESDDMANIEKTISKYKKIFGDVAKFTFIHGELKKQEVERRIEKFLKGEFNFLIATTMVDSGFSDKNLSFVFIENAERFGFAQLHQIRGRVGRGDKQGYCFLIPGISIDKMKDHTLERLSYLTKTEDGFDLSFKDVELRGTGDLKGTEQTGSDLNLNEWINEINFIDSYLKKVFVKN
jgi:ATP-dependent DNA helicase RecG